MAERKETASEKYVRALVEEFEQFYPKIEVTSSIDIGRFERWQDFEDATVYSMRSVRETLRINRVARFLFGQVKRKKIYLAEADPARGQVVLGVDDSRLERACKSAAEKTGMHINVSYESDLDELDF